MTDKDCKECEGEGYIEYGGIRHSYFGDDNDDGCETLPCPECNGDGYDEDLAYESWRDNQLE
jgi:hypothetical protein